MPDKRVTDEEIEMMLQYYPDSSTVQHKVALELQERRKSDWINVKENLPEVDTPVIGWGEECHWVCFVNDEGKWYDEVNELFNMTHWMPLPPPPEWKGER